MDKKIDWKTWILIVLFILNLISTGMSWYTKKQILNDWNELTHGYNNTDLETICRIYNNASVNADFR